MLRILAPLLAAAFLSSGAQAQSRFEEDAPTLPEGFSESFVPPARDMTGAYLTPNRALTPEQAAWHLRVALNVAALGCRGEEREAVVAGYNRMLEAKRAPLAAAASAVEAKYRAVAGARWQAANDDAMTRLYNFFALPPAQRAFCAAARDVIAEAESVAPERFTDYAAAALPRIEAPFLVSFATFDAYRDTRRVWATHRSTTPAVPRIELASMMSIAPGEK
ncbi:hypothetical protein [Sphingomonas immobilis]|uniref:DUF4142 domain-containing protein n=1 Tax=Sphingomonas immobilis TaxID=3063997 RepID=A0ABT9A2A0_9SPHN|nr:hypothetical protein [Sphingomonas sp. CA1-15]MDO7843958.1 hypothetical protein [Sphingomonas sp. CA1-15]